MSKGLYIHIPFCLKKCNYCDFLSAPADKETIDAYIEELLEEIKYKSVAFEDIYDEDSNDLDTIFIGGGTPSILDGEQLLRIMKCVDRNFYIMPEAEITMEVNPGTLTSEDKNDKLQAWKKAGINRISLGLQSANDEELKLLGRIHDYETFLDNFKCLRQAGFDNINVDLMSGLPGQTKEDWEKTLRSVCQLGPEHISAYSLIIEEGTPFHNIYSQDLARRDKGQEPELLPTEEEERAMYQSTKTILEEYGYYRYEISNYAKSGFECRHNLRYWERKDYIGVGLGAASLIENKRYKNLTDLRDYLGMFTNEEYLQYVSMYEEAEELDIKSQMEEFVFLGLRKTAGISPSKFDREFGRGKFEEIFLNKVKSFAGKNLMNQTADGNWCLTDQGLDVSNIIFADLLIDE